MTTEARMAEFRMALADSYRLQECHRPRSLTFARDHRVETGHSSWDERARDQLELGDHVADAIDRENWGSPEGRAVAIRWPLTADEFIAQRVRAMTRTGALR